MKARCILPNHRRHFGFITARCQFILPCCLSSALIAHAASGEEPPATRLAVEDVMAITLARNPTIAGSICERKSAALAVQSQAARYAYVLQLDTSWGHLATPSLAAGATQGKGVVTTAQQNSIGVGAQLWKRFSWGTDLTLRLDTMRQSSNTYFSLASLGPLASSFPGARPDGTIESHLGPGYGAALKLTAVQPLLRGAGATVVESELHVARANLSTAELARNRTASEILSSALTAYWEYWYASISVEIERRFLEVSRAQSKEAEARIHTGGLAPVDGLTFENQVATRAEDVVNAESERTRRRTDLARILGLAEDSDQLNLPLEVVPDTEVSSGRLVNDALAMSPELRQLESAVKVAKVQAQAAGDAFRPRLDLDAYVKAQGLGYNDVPAALRQLSGTEAMSVHVGLTFELPLDDTRHRAERARALLAVETARRKLAEARQRLLSDLENATTKESAANQRVELSGQTLDIARRRAAAEHARYVTGSSTAIQVLDAENAARAAELRMARARADLAQAHVNILHLTGRLLTDVGRQLSQADTTACTLQGAARNPQFNSMNDQRQN